ncbi:MAG: hypothetical protein AAF806_26110, partial [Bacteroidota bacterium]
MEYLRTRRFIDSLMSKVLKQVEESTQEIKRTEEEIKDTKKKIDSENQEMKATLQAANLKPEDYDDIDIDTPSQVFNELSNEALEVLKIMHTC